MLMCTHKALRKHFSKCVDLVRNLTHFVKKKFKVLWFYSKFNALWIYFSKCVATPPPFFFYLLGIFFSWLSRFWWRTPPPLSKTMIHVCAWRTKKWRLMMVVYMELCRVYTNPCSFCIWSFIGHQLNNRQSYFCTSNRIWYFCI